VLAGALLAGGSAHSISGADGAGPTRLESPAKIPPVAIAKPAAHATRDTLPYLALVVVDAKPPAAPAAVPRAHAPKAAAPVTVPKPVTAPRRDLAGFLSEQGHVMAPLSGEPGATPARLEGRLAPMEVEANLSATGTAPAITSAETDEPTPRPLVAQTFPSLSVDGVTLGAVTMRGDTVHLAAVLGLLQLRMPAEEFARLRGAPAADSFVSLATLREAGLAVTIDSVGERVTLAAL
jgi:hypothetical protein